VIASGGGLEATETARNLEQVLGDELSPAAAQQVIRAWSGSAPAGWST
jgi:hypothetical protein